MIDFLNDFAVSYHLNVGFCTTDVIIQRKEFFDRCADNYCGNYDTSWSCPPALDDVGALMDDVCSRYEHLALFSSVSGLKDSYDIEGMDRARRSTMKTCYVLQDMLMKREKDFYMVGSGKCELCAVCTYPDAPCRHPESMLYPFEALWIDVADLAHACDLKYMNGVNTVTYFFAVFF